MNQPAPLILASTSPYRQLLLAKLGISFNCAKPLYDEDSAKKHLRAKAPSALAEILAQGKAQSLATEENCVIGADQLISLDGEILGKSGNRENAIVQLSKMRGKTHQLITAVCVIFCGQKFSFTDITFLKMRSLTVQQIQNYVDLDRPFDCAGSYKIEQHGISLFDKVQCEDFSAIQGLPLIQLGNVLQEVGYTLLGSSHGKQ